MSNSNQVQTMSGTAVTDTNNKPVSKFDSFRSSIAEKKSSLEKVLPAHITFEKFQSVLMTACMKNPDLLNAHRPSLVLACVQSATDGLLPDGRDAALVPFNTKVGQDDNGNPVWGAKVQYMPMYSGILKKVRQSEELAFIDANVVYQNDVFEYELGDEAQIKHKPHLGADDRGPIIAAYCIAKLKDGTVYREVMSFHDIEKVRKSSKAGALSAKEAGYRKNKEAGKKEGDPKGIWESWYEEMAKKTVFRRIAKWLPQSVDKDGNEIRMFEEDESMEVLNQHEEGYTWNEDGEITPESDAQPDLKKIAADKKEERGDTTTVEKEEVEEKPQAKEKPAQEDKKPAEKQEPPVEENAEEGDPEPEPEKETKPEPAKKEKPRDRTNFDIESGIRKALKEAKTQADIECVVMVDMADDIQALDVRAPEQAKMLHGYIAKLQKELPEG